MPQDEDQQLGELLSLITDPNSPEVILESKVVEVLKERPDLISVWHKFRPSLLTLPERIRSELASALGEIEETYRSRDIARRVLACRRALGIESVSREMKPLLWAALHGELGTALSQLTTGNPAENLDEAIEHHELALSVWNPESHPEEWAREQEHLGIAYVKRKRGSRAGNIEAAIRCLESAMKERTLNRSPKEALLRVKNNLSYAYSQRIAGSLADNKEQAIHHASSALADCDRGQFPELWSDLMGNLGLAYLLRIRGDQLHSLDRAVDCFRSGLSVLHPDENPEKWALAQMNLSEAYARRAAYGGSTEHEAPFKHALLALEVYTHDRYPEQWAQLQNILAGFYTRLGGRSESTIASAETNYRNALRVYTRQDFPTQWASVQINLGSLLLEAAPTGRDDRRKEGVERLRSALKVYQRDTFPERWASVHHNLGLAYARTRRGEAESSQTAIEHFRLALEVRTLNGFPSPRLETLMQLGSLYFRESNWQEAGAAFAEAVAAGDVLLASAYTEAGRQLEIGSVSGAYEHLCYCLLKTNKPAAALLQLEAGRARLLAEALMLRGAQMQTLSEAERSELSIARQAVHELDAEMRVPPSERLRSDVELGEHLERARSKLREVIQSVRREHPGFMPSGLNVVQLLSVAPVGGVLVAPVITSQGSAVFVVPSGARGVKPEHLVWLGSLTSRDVHELLYGSSATPAYVGWLRSYIARGSTGRMMETAWQLTVRTATAKLWSLLMGPVHERIQDLGFKSGISVTLMPQGRLVFLPLHAAWRLSAGEERAFLDEYVVSFAPSGYAVEAAQKRISVAGPGPERILTVASPMRNLPYAMLEGQAVGRLFEPNNRRSLTENATSKLILQEASASKYIHFACHGFYNWGAVLESGLELADGELLTLSDVLSRVDLPQARLVTLSACETGLTEFRVIPDEFLGLPAGFLQAGTPGVVSSLWAVNDLSTMLVMRSFYSKHLTGIEPAIALQEAQLWLRDVSAAELADQFRKEMEEYGGEFREICRSAWRRFVIMDRATRPFREPVYWAAFTYTGR